jgi:hypothetical protein
MIQRDTLIKMINDNATVYVVNNELFSTRAAALKALRSADQVADILGAPRATIEAHKAYKFTSIVNTL